MDNDKHLRDIFRALSKRNGMPASIRVGPGRASIFSAAFQPRSKYTPHQGDRECFRRMRQLEGASK